MEKPVGANTFRLSVVYCDRSGKWQVAGPYTHTAARKFADMIRGSGCPKALIVESGEAPWLLRALQTLTRTVLSAAPPGAEPKAAAQPQTQEQPKGDWWKKLLGVILVGDLFDA